MDHVFLFCLKKVRKLRKKFFPSTRLKDGESVQSNLQNSFPESILILFAMLISYYYEKTFLKFIGKRHISFWSTFKLDVVLPYVLRLVVVDWLSPEGLRQA